MPQELGEVAVLYAHSFCHFPQEYAIAFSIPFHFVIVFHMYHRHLSEAMIITLIISLYKYDNTLKYYLQTVHYLSVF